MSTYVHVLNLGPNKIKVITQSLIDGVWIDCNPVTELFYQGSTNAMVYSQRRFVVEEIPHD